MTIKTYIGGGVDVYTVDDNTIVLTTRTNRILLSRAMCKELEKYVKSLTEPPSPAVPSTPST